MDNKLTPELMEKARQAKSAEELLVLAKENAIELTEDDAKDYFERLNKSGEVSDEELGNVSGGCGSDLEYKSTSQVCCTCRRRILSVRNKKTGESWWQCNCTNRR